ncbi:hypothetical protein SS50377_28263 [Spironucleus salmonicida]|uniref:Uncharacterized protein n=1 Tax=Spironucleus salmonicida TaxID=348837 RepID=V6LXJ6_9EUKA|nr:hypothetical protein SS50377_28263 [Spironucleus salmonicida]|eukprot:EST48441.1 Hypothetical protein SS50377_11391 [Spironucleus salmonicida]
MEKIWENLQFSTDLPSGNELKNFLTEDYQKQRQNSSIDLKLIKQKQDFTSGFDYHSYLKQPLLFTRFPTNDTLNPSVLSTALQEQQIQTNHKLLNENIDLRKENATLREDNADLQNLINHQKHENYLDYQLIEDLCKRYLITITSSDIKENLRKLIAYFTVNQTKYEKEVKIYDIRYDNYNKYEIQSLNHKLKQLEQQVILEQQQRQSANDSFNSILVDNQKLKTDIYNLQIQNINLQQNQCKIQHKLDTTTLQQLKVFDKDIQLIEFSQFQKQLFRANQILNLSPNLTIAEVLEQIIIKIIELKTQVVSEKILIQSEKIKSVKEAQNRKIFIDINNSQEYQDKFGKEIENLLEIDDLENIQQQNYQNITIIQQQELIMKFQPILDKIQKIGKGMDFQGDQIQILDQIWQFIMDQ